MVFRIFLIVSSLILALQISAQNKTFCGTPHDVKSEKFLNDFFEGIYIGKDNMDILWVPMTVHIVGPSSGELPYFDTKSVIDALCTLNEDFTDTDIQFYLSEIKYIFNDNYYSHNFQNGIQMMNSNNVFGTANTYFVDNPANNCGYFAPSGQAVAVAFGCAGKGDHTWAHEMGHYYSLPHTFRGWEGQDYEEGDIAPLFINSRKVEKAIDDEDCDVAGDRFCDTPADYLSFRWNCNGDQESPVLQTDPDSITFRSDGTYFMSYSNSSCMNRFSPMQMEAMRANLQNTKGSQIDPDFIQEVLDANDTKLSTPENNAKVEDDDVLLTWEEFGKAKYYYLELSRVQGFQIIERTAVVEGNSHIFYDLKNNSKYFWRISAYGNSDFCGLPSDPFSFETSYVVSTDESNLEREFEIYPNPSRSVLHFSFNRNTSINTKVFDYTGKLINEIQDVTDGYTWNHDLRSGLYFVEITIQNQKITKKIIVQ